MDNRTVANKMLRFSTANWPLDFEECANEHLLEENLCPNPGAKAEILKDYVTANNYRLRFIPSLSGGITGGEEENRTTLRLLALREIDFAGFDFTYRIPPKNFLQIISL